MFATFRYSEQGAETARKDLARVKEFVDKIVLREQNQAHTQPGHVQRHTWNRRPAIASKNSAFAHPVGGLLN
jgi:hypothetical protein